MKLRIKKLHPDAQVPTYGTAGAACFDLYARLDVDEALDMQHGDPVTICTGLAFEIPAGHVMLVFGRSGHGFRHDTRLANCVGVIDSDYRGEVMVRLTRDTARNTWPMRVRHGDRIAQAMVLPVQQVEFETVDQLSNTTRGVGGLGSTGS